MKMKKTSFLLFACLISFLFFSCSKGLTGGVGETGPAGPTGNNVLPTKTTYSIVPTQWVGIGNGAYTCIEADNQISSYASDIVKVFLQEPLVTLIPPYLPLPLANTGLNGAADVDILSFSFTADQITFKYTNYDNINPIPPQATAIVIVYIIPPSLMIKHPDTDWNNAVAIARLPEMQMATTSSVR